MVSGTGTLIPTEAILNFLTGIMIIIHGINGIARKTDALLVTKYLNRQYPGGGDAFKVAWAIPYNNFTARR